METIIFLIIIGILSSIFGKAKGNSKSGRAKPFIFKKIDDIRTPFNRELQTIPPKRQGQISTGQIVQQSEMHEVEKKYLQIKQESEPSRKDRSNTQPINTQKSRDTAENILPEALSEKDIVNGIIWSEILGEPRSKNPYSAKKRLE